MPMHERVRQSAVPCSGLFCGWRAWCSCSYRYGNRDRRTPRFRSVRATSRANHWQLGRRAYGHHRCPASRPTFCHGSLGTSSADASATIGADASEQQRESHPARRRCRRWHGRCSWCRQGCSCALVRGQTPSPFLLTVALRWLRSGVRAFLRLLECCSQELRFR